GSFRTGRTQLPARRQSLRCRTGSGQSSARQVPWRLELSNPPTQNVIQIGHFISRQSLRVHAIITSQLPSCRTAREASTRVSTRHARVRAPHLPVSQCEVILAAVLSNFAPEPEVTRDILYEEPLHLTGRAAGAGLRGGCGGSVLYRPSQGLHLA